MHLNHLAAFLRHQLLPGLTDSEQDEVYAWFVTELPPTKKQELLAMAPSLLKFLSSSHERRLRRFGVDVTQTGAMTFFYCQHCQKYFFAWCYKEWQSDETYCQYCWTYCPIEPTVDLTKYFNHSNTQMPDYMNSNPSSSIVTGK